MVLRAAPRTSLLALAIALVASPARAEGPMTDVFLACPSGASTRIEAAVGTSERAFRWTRVSRIEAADVVRRPAEEQGHGRSRVWVDCSRPDRVRLAFADPSLEHFLVRDVPAPRGLGEVTLETLAQVIDSSLSALESDPAVGLDRAQVTSVLAPAPEPSPVAPPSEARPEARAASPG
jgi:hypothetical protein